MIFFNVDLACVLNVFVKTKFYICAKFLNSTMNTFSLKYLLSKMSIYYILKEIYKRYKVTGKAWNSLYTLSIYTKGKTPKYYFLIQTYLVY